MGEPTPSRPHAPASVQGHRRPTPWAPPPSLASAVEAVAAWQGVDDEDDAALDAFTRDLQRVEAAFDRAHAALVRDSTALEAARAWARIRLVPHLTPAPVLARAIEKPQGYPGDFGVMELLYAADSLGDTPYARRLHVASCRLAASRAVRSRLDYLVAALQERAHRARPRVPRVMSVGAGSARELERYRARPHAAALDVTLLDQDPDALALARQNATSHADRAAPGWKVAAEVITVQSLLRDPKALETIAPQDLIYASGLADYFGEVVVRRLVSTLASRLTAGGTLYVGNFDHAVTTCGLMSIALDWPVVTRSRRDMAALAPSGMRCRVEAEREGLNLFLVVEAP